MAQYTKSGDTEYLGELRNRYIPLLHRFYLKYLQNDRTAQNLRLLQKENKETQRNKYATIVSIATCLAIGFSISTYFLSLEKESIKSRLIAINGSSASFISQPSNTNKLHAPQPIVGKRKYRKYLENHLIHPTDAACKNVKGKVVLSFFVDRKGKPQRIVIIQSLCKSADKEAIRLIKQGPRWTYSILPVEIKVKF